MIKNIGIVGTGDIAKQFATQIDKSKYEIVSMFNHREASLIPFAKDNGIGNYTTNYDEFLSNSNLECVYIGSPNQTHYTYAKQALEAGKHVLCEKVMVLSGDQAKELFELAESKNLVLLEAVTLFYMPMYHEVKKLIAAGDLGKISNASVIFGSCKEYDPTNRFFSKELGGGALFDIGTYALSAAVYLLGTDLNFVASDVELAPTGVDEKSVTLLKTTEGVQVSVMISFRGKMPKQVVLTGDNGFLKIDDFPRAEEGTIFYNDGQTKVVNLGNGRDVFTYEIDLLNDYATGKIEGIDVREVTEHVISLMDDMRASWGIN